MLVIKKICDYTIPIFGNKRVLPYAKLLVSDGITKENAEVVEVGGYNLPANVAHSLDAVSYTHLTLPTILRV